MLDAAGRFLAEIYDLWPSYVGMLTAAAALWFLALTPLKGRRIRANVARARLRPRAAEIQERNRGDLAATTRELNALYAREGAMLGKSAGLAALLDIGAIVVLWLVLADLGSHVERGTALAASLGNGGRELPLGMIDLADSALAAPGIGLVTVPVAVMVLYLVPTLAARRRIAAAQRLDTSPYPPGAERLSALALALVALFLPVGVALAMVTVALLRTGADLLVAGRRPGRRPRKVRAPRRPRPAGTPRPDARSTPAPRRARPPADDPVTAFAKGSAKANQLAQAGKTDRAIAVRIEAAGALIEEAAPDELAAQAKPLRETLAEIVTADAGTGMSLFGRLRRKAPATARGTTAAAVLAARVDASPAAPLAREWMELEPLFLETLEDEPAKAIPPLAKGLREVPPQRRSSDFSRFAAERVLQWLDGSLRLATAKRKPAGGRAALQLLEQLEFSGRSLTEAEAFCALGDLALADGRRIEARERYRAAAVAGSPPGRDRLAHQLAEEGRQSLVEGNAHAAKAQLAEAVELNGDPAYAVLLTSAEVLAAAGSPLDVGPPAQDLLGADWDIGDPESLRTALAGAAEAGGDPAAVALWTALIDLAAGRRDEATGELRRLAAGQASGLSVNGASAQAAVLLAEVEGDGEALVGFGRRLMSERGGAWLSASPVDPLPLLHAVAERDPELLAAMVGAVEHPDELPGWLRDPAAHALIARAAQRAAAGAPVEAERLLDMADRCLEDNP